MYSAGECNGVFTKKMANMHFFLPPLQRGKRTEMKRKIAPADTACRRSKTDMFSGYLRGSGGETGIRTLETVSRLHTFQACAFDHSATSP